MVVAALLFVPLTAAGAQIVIPPAIPVIKDWNECVQNTAEVYAKTTETAEAVARLALMTCRHHRLRFLNSITDSTRGDVDRLEKSIFEQTAVFVMEQRLKRR